MERNLTDAFIVGTLYRFQFDGEFATNWISVVATIPPCWVLVKEDPKQEYSLGELINLNNVARVIGREFNGEITGGNYGCGL